MIDDVLINKAATIERCVQRAREEYDRAPDTFTSDITRQDAAILNIQRACEAALDMGQHLIRREKLGVPQSSRDVFALLAKAGWIDAKLAERLQAMVGFRNIAVHDYQALQMPIVIAVITHHLDDFGAYSKALLMHKRKTNSQPPESHPSILEQYNKSFHNKVSSKNITKDKYKMSKTQMYGIEVLVDTIKLVITLSTSIIGGIFATLALKGDVDIDNSLAILSTSTSGIAIFFGLASLFYISETSINGEEFKKTPRKLIILIALCWLPFLISVGSAACFGFSFFK